MSEALKQASLEAIERSTTVLAEVQQEKARIRETLKQSRDLDERVASSKSSFFRVKSRPTR